MQVDELTQILDNDQLAHSWFQRVGCVQLERAHANLNLICRSRMTLDQVVHLVEQFDELSAEISDPDMAFNNLEKFIAAARSPLALGAMFQRDPTALPILLRIFSASQYLSDLLIRDTEAYDSLRLTQGQLYSRNIVVDELKNSISHASESMQAMQILRRFKHRESLRIAFGDLIVGHHFDQVVEQISFLADAVVEAALHFAEQNLIQKCGEPQSTGGERSRYVVFALGKLGGRELNYSSDIDLIAVYEHDGKTSINQKSNLDFFHKLTRDFVKLINETTSLGAAYRVDLRLRPEGSRGPICCSSNSFLQYYDLKGRNWERQALIKARPVAGDLELGSDLLQKLKQWVYRPILNRIDIGEIKSLKRQIEHRTLVAGEERTNVKTGHGGIRDIEFTIQFLQLLNGGAIKSVRTVNTLKAIRKLAETDCLNQQEADLLSQNYCWLRKLEHFLQIMFDLQTHTLPDDKAELKKIAIRMGYRRCFNMAALDQFKNDLREVTDVNHRILDHLLHNAFSSADETETNSNGINAVDLVLQSDLGNEEVAEILNCFGIADTKNGQRMLESLAMESTLFLSSRRCRHFLAAIVTPLLEKIAQTPDPDATLVSLSSVADAIGGKGALWELFSFNPPSLDLFVRLCASSDYLCSIVRRNPGMIDELIDSLLMDRLPSIEWLRLNLNDLTTGASEPAIILQSFKSLHHLRVGVRDIVGKDSIRATHRALSDVAEVCLQYVIEFEFERLAGKHTVGNSINDAVNRNGFVVLAMGKLGGLEPNYHSDLDVVFLYDSQADEENWLDTSPQHFYSQLAARVSKAVTAGPKGKLFDLDSRLRPSGKSGALAVSLQEFSRYFESGEGQLWERLAICKARPVFGRPELQQRVNHLLQGIVIGANWNEGLLSEIHAMRMRMQENCQPANLKRGVGGTVDVEFIVQMLQLKHAVEHPNVLVTGTIEALDQLIAIEAIERFQAVYLIQSYQFLRGVESRLRLMNTTARHDLPEGAALEKLAYLLKMDRQDLVKQVGEYRRKNRELFEYFFQTDQK